VTELTTPNLCERHRPPAGIRRAEIWTAIAMAVTANFLRRPEIVRECGGDPDAPPGQKLAHTKLIRSVIVRHAPICCYIDQGEMRRIWTRYARPTWWRRLLLAIAGYDWSELQKWRAKS
jgi:hypothetical protein